jgi:hypothetical protein
MSLWFSSAFSLEANDVLLLCVLIGWVWSVFWSLWTNFYCPLCILLILSYWSSFNILDRCLLLDNCIENIFSQYTTFPKIFKLYFCRKIYLHKYNRQFTILLFCILFKKTLSTWHNKDFFPWFFCIDFMISVFTYRSLMCSV